MVLKPGNFPTSQAPLDELGAYSKPSYDLPPEQIELLLSDLKNEAMPSQDTFTCYVVDGSSKYANIARVLERSAFEITNDTAETFQKEYGAYEKDSTFYFVINESGEIIAVTRVIKSHREGMEHYKNKTITDMAAKFNIPAPDLWTGLDRLVPSKNDGPDIPDGLDSIIEDTWDIATVGVVEGVRGEASSSIALAIMFSNVLEDLHSQPHVRALTAVVNNHMNERCEEARIFWKPLHKRIPRDFFYISCEGNNAGYLPVSDLDKSLIGNILELHGEKPEVTYLTHRIGGAGLKDAA